MIGTRIIVGALCVVAGAVSAGVAADGIVVGTGERHVLTADGDIVQTAPLRLSPYSALEKTGAGRLEIHDGAFTENERVEIDVREGTLALTSSEPPSAYQEPAEIMSRAAFWLESQTHLQSRADGGDGEVETWLDVRETGRGGGGSAYLYPRAVAFTNDWLTAFPLAKSYQDRLGVWFRGYGSGCFMNWLNSDGTQANVKDIRHVFIVHGGETSRGDVLGQRCDGQPYFQRSDNRNIWVYHNAENKPLHASRTYLNGELVDPFTRGYDAQSVHVVEVEALGQPLSAMCLFNDRDMQLKTTAGTNMAVTAEGKKVNAILGTTDWCSGGNRVGGEYVFEMMLFTNELTSAERIAVSDWLNQKWRGTPPPTRRPATVVRLATNTTVEVASEGASLTVVGDGCLRKMGDGGMALRPVFGPRNSSARVEVCGGTVNLGYGLPLVCAAGDTIDCEQTLAGAVLSSPIAGTDKTRLVKKGAGQVTIDSVPSGVSKIHVKAGGLHIASPERASCLVAPTFMETATIPNADFEAYSATAHADSFSYIADGKEVNGWHAIVPPMNADKIDSAVFFFDHRLGEPSGGWKMVMQEEPTCVLVVKNVASAWCEVAVPRDGYYELSFRAAPRNNSYAGAQLGILIGPDADSLVSLGEFKTSSENAWKSYSLGPVRLTAGTYQLWLKSNGVDNDRCTQFDDFRLAPYRERPEWTIPNGDFERHSAAFSDVFTLDNTNAVLGFAVGQRTETSKFSGNNSASSFSVDGADGYKHFNKPWNRSDSRTQFCMAGSGASLSTAFIPPAGTWRLRADFSLWCIAADSATNYSVAANVRIGEEDIPLGVVTNTSHAMLPHDWPGTFTVDGNTPVSLVLTGGVGTEEERNGHGLLDNLVLAAVWPCDQFTRSFEGDGGHMRLAGDGTVGQTVTVRSAGLYRLSANLASSRTAADGRDGEPAYGSGHVAFYLAKSGVTNWIGRTEAIAPTNFNEYAFLAMVPEAGAYDVGLKVMPALDENGSGDVDNAVLVDAVQFYRVETAAPIGLPADLEIHVASDAHLSLDFEGTNEIRRLVIGGRSRVGNVSLIDCPELLGTLSGPGTLSIRPRGTTLIIR